MRRRLSVVSLGSFVEAKGDDEEACDYGWDCVGLATKEERQCNG